jgi:hypothetical protein
MQPLPQSRIEFLDLLIEHAVIPISTAEVLKSKTRDDWIPLGKILRRQGHLNMGQLLELLQLQAQRPSVRLGELAVQRGFCSEDHVLNALRMQFDSGPHPLEIVWRDEGCDRERLVAALTTYIRRLESRLQRPLERI